MKTNKAWHDKNKMPKNAKFDERIKWHLEHQKNCGCRPIPKKLAEAIDKEGIKFENPNTSK